MYKKEIAFRYKSGNTNFVDTSTNQNVPEFNDIEIETTLNQDNASVETIFEYFRRFLLSIGYIDSDIVIAACDIVFSDSLDSHSKEIVREYGNFTPSDEINEKIETEVQIRLKNYIDVDKINDRNTWENKYWELRDEYQEKILELNAKLSRYEKPDSKEYTKEEMNHIEYVAQKNGGVLNISTPLEEDENEEDNPKSEHRH